MEPWRIPSKTPKARQVLQGRDFPGTRAQRALLIMADGRKTLQDLSGAIRSLGLSLADLQALAADGWVTWHGEAHGAAAVDIEVPVAQTEPPGPARTLAAAKFFALDLVARMLGTRDEVLRRAAREVADADALLAWLDQCMVQLRTEHGDEPAELFHLRVRVVLPPEVLHRWVR